MSTKITDLPLQSNNITDNDYLLADIFNGSTYDTKKFVKSRLLGFVSYVAILIQTDTDNPVVVELQNEIGSLTVERVDKGVYRIIGNEYMFLPNKTIVFIGSTIYQVSQTVGINEAYCVSAILSDDAIQITTYDMDNNLNDNQLKNTPIEIRIYN